MANASEIQVQAVRPAKETQETRPSTSDSAPSRVAQNLGQADRSARARDYEQRVSSHDFRNVESDNGDMTILNSHNVGNASNPETDQAYGVSVSTAANYRLFEQGGQTRQRSEAPAAGADSADADESRELLSQGLRRGRFTV